MAKKTKNNENADDKNIKVRKPLIVLNNATKFYLATRELSTGEDNPEFYFIISLFMPVKNGRRIESDIQTEISTFNDDNSADVYRQTLEQYCAFNEKSINSEIISGAIKHFNQTADFVIQKNEERCR